MNSTTNYTIEKNEQLYQRNIQNLKYQHYDNPNLEIGKGAH